MTDKIAINGRCFTRRITGVERYAHEIISKRIQPSPQIIAPKKILSRYSGHLWEQLILPTKLHGKRILWSPANAGPWLVQNQVVTLHDASIFDHPEWFQPLFAAWARLSWKILASRARAIITVSEFSRERLKHYLKISENKIHVIYNGVGKPFEMQTQKKIKEFQDKYSIVQPYFLFVGTHEPRKNLRNLIYAWKQSNLIDHTLIVAGTRGNIFADSIAHSDESDNIKWLGYIPDNYLPALYAGATAAIIPSFYEGFGLAILEAMACGAPLITSNTSSFPEIVEDAALQINPHQIKEIAHAMQEIIEDSHLTNRLREFGLQRARHFSWDTAARNTQALLESFQ